ncbi:unnamed protein product [Pelagomonas calceolata]|uniref:ATP synthase subunit d, mitochondrial n=1 Tax=Pelagomonas calceolata TaxID=35677 RepID=A0A8J2SLT3_9STRA|nr:unnamed protein product [Pelagomonas calceolata]
MLARATARAAARAARAAPRRSVNLSALEAKVTSDEGKQELNRLKMALNEAELLKQKYSSAPAAIDFAAYKGKVDASLLALVEPRPLAEKEFKGVQYPPFAELDEAKAEYDAMFAEAQQKIAESKTRIDELTKQMNVMVAKKVGHATTVDDVYEAYPDIEKEVDDEIDKHEWAKDAV